MARFRLCLLAVPLILVCLVLAYHLFQISSGCPFRQMFGVHCPGCGGTRAVASLSQWQLGNALNENALVVAALVGGLPLLGLSALQAQFPELKFLRVFRWCHGWLWSLLLAIGVFGVLRNFEAFSWLAPSTR